MNDTNIDTIFNIIEYFSLNYPYTQPQLETFFNVCFDINDNDIKKFLPKKFNGDARYIQYIELRGNNSGKQLMEIKFLPLTFTVKYKYLDEIMQKIGYTEFAYISNAFYAKLMDAENNVGTIRIGYEFFEEFPDRVEITDLIFDTYENFQE